MGSKGTTIKDALSKWEKKQVEKAKIAAENPDQLDMGGTETAQKASDAKVVKLIFELPPIEKMDASLSTLANCEQLSLSSNQIEKIGNLNGLKNLKILSLARNQIKNLNGLDAVQETLQQLWISYNFIEKLKGIQALKKLQVLYMVNNSVKDWEEFNRLNQLPCLVELNFVGNPLEDKHSVEGDWSDQVKKRLTSLKKLDGVPIIRDNADADEDAD